MLVRPFRFILLGGAMLGACDARDARTPPGYPADYGAIMRQADRERTLVIWSAVDRIKTAALIAAFRAAHPALAVTYVEMPGGALNDRFLDAVSRGLPTPDLLWSSAMDLQIKLANDGYAQGYASPEADALPHWANWKNEAWGTTAEPIVMIYNRRLIADAAMPTTRADLSRLLEQRSPALRGKVATYDLARSAVGFLYLMQDKQASPDVWRLVRAMGANGSLFYANGEDIMRAVRRGDAVIGYNVIGSYARDEARRDPTLGIVMPRDYTLVTSRIALIPKSAPHPASARLFLDFLLSRKGQHFLVARSMPSVRIDLPSIGGPLAPSDARLRAIRVGPALLVDRDTLTRRYFLKKWHMTFCTGAAENAAKDAASRSAAGPSGPIDGPRAMAATQGSC